MYDRCAPQLVQRGSKMSKSHARMFMVAWLLGCSQEGTKPVTSKTREPNFVVAMSSKGKARKADGAAEIVATAVARTAKETHTAARADAGADWAGPQTMRTAAAPRAGS